MAENLCMMHLCRTLLAKKTFWFHVQLSWFFKEPVELIRTRKYKTQTKLNYNAVTLTLFSALQDQSLEDFIARDNIGYWCQPVSEDYVVFC